MNKQIKELFQVIGGIMVLLFWPVVWVLSDGCWWGFCGTKNKIKQ
jgi:hypothetical protein